MKDTNTNNDYEYIFVDIEWNVNTNTLPLYDPVRIGITACDKNMILKKSLSKVIHPSSIDTVTKKTFKMTHTSREVLMKGKNIDDVFTSVSKTFSSYRYIVVWTKTTYDIFKECAKKAGIRLPKHSPVLLQNVIMDIANNCTCQPGFESVLKAENIEYVPSALHNSKYDAKYLFDLYSKLYNKYSIISSGRDKCVSSNKSNILHCPQCKYTANIKDENLIFIDKSEIFKGYVP